MGEQPINFHNERAQAITMLRNWARDNTEFQTVQETFTQLHGAMRAVLDEFCIEFDVKGVRYWEHPESDSRFITWPHEVVLISLANSCVELARHEFLSREKLWFGYEDRL